VEYSHLWFLNPSLKIFLDFTVIPVLISGKLFSLDRKLYSCTVFFCRNGFWKMDRIEDSNRQAKQLDDLIEKIECKRYVRLSSILQSSATCKVFICPFIFTPTLLLITYSYQHPFRSFVPNLKFLDWICIVVHICLVFGCCLSSVCRRFKGMFILSTNLGWHFLYILKVVLFAFTKLIGFLKVPLIKCKSTSVMCTGTSVWVTQETKTFECPTISLFS
jgi:hypothetical protein